MQDAVKDRERGESEGSHKCELTQEPGLCPSQGQSHSRFLHVLFEEMNVCVISESFKTL